jgi:gamma-glutamyl-gamma-aminobutyrate hydrolase PuuD
VEAYESIPSAPDPYGKPFGERILAVQFHPESFTQAGDPTFLKIFQDLVRRTKTAQHLNH